MRNQHALDGGDRRQHGRLTATCRCSSLPTAADVHLYRVVPKTVSVTVSGSPEAIAGLQANQIRATVDLTGMDAAQESEAPVEVSVPSGVTLVSVEPAKVGVVIPPPAK